MKSGKYTLGYKTTLKTLRQGKCKIFYLLKLKPNHLIASGHIFVCVQLTSLLSLTTALLSKNLRSSTTPCSLKPEFITILEVNYCFAFFVYLCLFLFLSILVVYRLNINLNNIARQRRVGNGLR